MPATRWALAAALALTGIGCGGGGRGEVALAIASISTGVARSGETVIIRGEGFGVVGGRVTFGGVEAAIESWDPVAIAAVVPRQTHPAVEVRVERGGEASAPSPFTIFDAMANADGSAGSATTFVSVTFDDTDADQLNAREALALAGIHATFFVNSTRIGSTSPDQPAYLTLAQLRSLQTDGHEIGGHTLQHVDLTLLSADEVLREICDDRARLLALGLQVQSFAYPFGAWNDDVARAAASCGYRGARALDHAGAPWPSSAPPLKPFAIPTASPFVATTSLEKMQAAVTEVEQKGGGWVPVIVHHVCSDGCSSIAVAPETLGAFVQWLAARAPRGTVARTVRQMIGGGVAPAPLPAPTLAPPSGPNLLPNSSFEDFSHGPLRPACWLLGDTGHETAHWSTIPGYTGATALMLSPGEPVRANRRIKLMPVAGCAPSASPGAQLYFSAWYKSDVPLRINAAVRNLRGFWATSWALSASIPPSPDAWALATWALPKIPAEHDALTVNVRLEKDDGFMALDELSLTER